MPDRLEGRAAAAAAAAGVLVGTGIVATRFVIDQTEPLPLALLRYLIGLACLLPPALLAPKIRFERGDLLPIGLLGVLQFAGIVGLLNYALAYITAALGALIFATVPLLTLLLAALLRVEPMTRVKALGVALVVLGVGAALFDKLQLTPASGATLLGVLLAFASAMTGALCNVLYRPYLRRYPTMPVSVYAMACAVMVLAAATLATGELEPLISFTPAGWAAVLFIGISSGVGYYCWLWALKHSTPTKAAVFLNLSPLVAAVLGLLLLAEPVSWLFGLGLLLVLSGLWLTTRATSKRAPLRIEPSL